MYGRLRQAQGDITTDVRRVPGFDGLSKSVMHTVLRSGKVNLRDDRRRYEDITKMGVRVWTAFIWLKIGSSGKLF
jgi:hypothetical protein